MLDLSPRDLAIVRDILRKYIPDYEVWAFGSRTKGTSRRYSDLDLAIITDAPLSLQVRGDMAEDFSESDLPFRVDILDWATTQDYFRRIVEQDRIILQPGREP
ncbi:MAG: type restriction enzyme subunit [Acetobacteraceae bacterium]|jgi:type I restriction enzyme S subunit|nr:type restriction enzyme subunit [Acetobacteraceae bacterium]